MYLSYTIINENINPISLSEISIKYDFIIKNKYKEMFNFQVLVHCLKDYLMITI